MANRNSHRMTPEVHHILEEIRIIVATSLLHEKKQSHAIHVSDILVPMLQAQGLLDPPSTEEEKWLYITVNRAISTLRTSRGTHPNTIVEDLEAKP